MRREGRERSGRGGAGGEGASASLSNAAEAELACALYTGALDQAACMPVDARVHASRLPVHAQATRSLAFTWRAKPAVSCPKPVLG
jgi:hypothetical protein